MVKLSTLTSAFPIKLVDFLFSDTEAVTLSALKLIVEACAVISIKKGI